MKRQADCKSVWYHAAHSAAIAALVFGTAIPAAAAEETGDDVVCLVGTDAEFVAAVENPDCPTIRLTADLTPETQSLIEGPLDIGRDLVLDLANFDLEIDTATDWAFDILNQVNFELQAVDGATLTAFRWRGIEQPQIVAPYRINLIEGYSEYTIRIAETSESGAVQIWKNGTTLEAVSTPAATLTDGLLTIPAGLTALDSAARYIVAIPQPIVTRPADQIQTLVIINVTTVANTETDDNSGSDSNHYWNDRWHQWWGQNNGQNSNGDSEDWWSQDHTNSGNNNSNYGSNNSGSNYNGYYEDDDDDVWSSSNMSNTGSNSSGTNTTGTSNTGTYYSGTNTNTGTSTNTNTGTSTTSGLSSNTGTGSLTNLTTSTVTYANCAAVKAAGKAPLLKGQPGYAAALDADNDGIACEDSETGLATGTGLPTSTPTPTPSASSLINLDTTLLTGTETGEEPLATTGVDEAVPLDLFAATPVGANVVPASFTTAAAAHHTAQPRTAKPATGVGAAMENPKVLASSVACSLATAAAAAWAIKANHPQLVDGDYDEFENFDETELEGPLDYLDNEEVAA